MKEQYLTFRRFSNSQESDDFIAFLKEEAIPFQLEDASASFDVSFSGNTYDKEVHVKLRPSDFEAAQKLLLKRSDYDKSEFPEDYYLFQFSNEELTDILIRPDEWSAIDYNLAQKILRERGKDIDPEFLETLIKKRNKVLSKPEESQRNWIYIGYVFALLGGLIGIFIGWHLLTFKKTLTSGKRAYGYIPSDRKHGRNILILGLVIAAIWVVFGFTFRYIPSPYVYY